MHQLTIPEQVDQAVTALIERRPPAFGAGLADEVAAARLVRDGLAPVPLSARFEAELARRLAHPGPLEGLPLPVAVRHHWRWIAAAAAVTTGSLAVALTGALLAFRRTGRGE